jgi:hypothetical protein
MSKDLLWVPVATGLQNGVNPCLLMTAALVLLGLQWFKKSGISFQWVLLLLASLVISGFIFNCGYLDLIVLNSSFERIIRWIDVPIAIFVGIKGIQFFRRWYLLIQGKEEKPSIDKPVKFPSVLLALLIVLAGFLLSLLASVWPVNYYITVLSIYMKMPGLFFSLGSLILFYTVLSLWMVYMVLWLFSMQNKNQRMFNIIASAILLCASLGVLDIIFMKG